MYVLIKRSSTYKWYRSFSFWRFKIPSTVSRQSPATATTGAILSTITASPTIEWITSAGPSSAAEPSPQQRQGYSQPPKYPSKMWPPLYSDLADKTQPMSYAASAQQPIIIQPTNIRQNTTAVIAWGVWL